MITVLLSAPVCLLGAILCQTQSDGTPTGPATKIPPIKIQERFYGQLHTMLPTDSEDTQAVVLFDFDWDGDLDAFQANREENRLCFNDGIASFVDESSRLPQESFDTTDVAVGDVDADGDLDLVLASGPFGDKQNRLYLNRGKEWFLDATDRLPVDADRTAAVALGDADGDGDLDVLFGSNIQDRLYLNDGAGSFTDATSQLPAVVEQTSDIALADLDADGDLDAFIAAGSGTDPNRLYLNDGTGTFLDASSQLPVDLNASQSVDLGDVDGDGDLDALIGNSTSSGQSAEQNWLYLNDGAGVFSDATGQLPVARDTTRIARLVDADADGDLDAYFGNENRPNDFTDPTYRGEQNRLYLNDGLGVYSDGTDQLVQALDVTLSAAFGDLDGDQDIDLYVGNSGSNRLQLGDGSGLFTDAGQRTPPEAGPSNGVALGDVDGDGILDVVLARGIGSDPLVGNALYLGARSGVFTDISENLPVGDLTTRGVALGDVDGDGDFDLFCANLHDGDLFPLGQDNYLYLNDGSGVFSDATHQLPTAFPQDDIGLSRSALFVDVDGDEDLDVVLGKDVDFDGEPRMVLYLNDGAGVFTDAPSQILGPLGSTVEYLTAGDVDGDVDVDLLYVTQTPYERIYLLLNDGSGTFTDETDRLPPLIDGGSITHLNVGDVDGDGHVDIVAGHIEFPILKNLLYLNDGMAFFTDASDRVPDEEVLPKVTDRFVLGDVDGDDDLDLVASSRLFTNDGTGRFADTMDQFPPGLGRVDELVLADLDGDEDLDAFLATDPSVVWSNLTRHTAWRALPRIGRPLELDVYGSAGTPWLLLASNGTGDIGTPYGRFYLDPLHFLVVAMGVLDDLGHGGQSLQIAPDPALVGSTMFTQAAVGSPMRLTNLEETTLTGF